LYESVTPIIRKTKKGKENPKLKGQLIESKEELGESERDPGRGVSDRLGESGLKRETLNLGRWGNSLSFVLTVFSFGFRYFR